MVSLPEYAEALKVRLGALSGDWCSWKDTSRACNTENDLPGSGTCAPSVRSYRRDPRAGRHRDILVNLFPCRPDGSFDLFALSGVARKGRETMRAARRSMRPSEVPPRARQSGPRSPKYSFQPYRNDSAMPLRSRFTIRPVCRPLTSRTAPFWLVRMIACAPRMTVAPAAAAP